MAANKWVLNGKYVPAKWQVHLTAKYEKRANAKNVSSFYIQRRIYEEIYHIGRV